MEVRSNKRIKAIFFSMILFGIILLGGCGDSGAGKAVTDLTKKIVGEEVTKQGDEIKKKIDQVKNLGSDNEKKEGGGSSEGKSEKGPGNTGSTSDEGSDEKDD